MIPRTGSSILVVTTACLFANARALTGQPPADSAEKGNADSTTARLIVERFWSDAAEAAHIPGLVIVVVTDTTVLFAEGYGLADIEARAPMTTRTGLRVGSVSKPVTATAVLQMVERGAMSLDAPVSEYISGFDLEDAQGRASTIAELLTHRGGYDDTVIGSHAPSFGEWQRLEDYVAEDLAPRPIPPGTVMSYTSWGHALLGVALREVDGRPYDEVIAENLFAPLGMTRSAFTQPLPESLMSQLATGYGFSSGSYQIVPHDFVRLSPGVALVTTGEDMGRFMRTLLAGGQLDGARVLEPETVRLLVDRQIGAHPLSGGRTYGFSELTLAGRKVVYHDGNGIGFSNRMILVPEHDIGIFVSINHRSLSKSATSTVASREMKRLATELIEALVPSSRPEVARRDPMPDAATRASRFEGQYRLAGIPRHDFFRMAGLSDKVDVVDAGDGAVRIGAGTWFEVEPLLFQHTEVPSAFVVFVEDDLGEV